MRTFKPTPFQIDNDRFYYEPRVLWSVARVGNTLTPQSPLQPKGFVELDRNHFQNGGKYPIRITHAIISPVGYLYRDKPATSAPYVDQCMAGLGRIRARISFPKSSWIERVDTDVMSFGNVPTAEPIFSDDPDFFQCSGLFGTSRWTFDPSLMVPRKATINLELSSIQTYNLDGFDGNVYASLAVHERGGRMLGHARTREPMIVPAGPSFTANGFAWPQNHTAVIGDQYAISSGKDGGATQGFPPEQKWKSNAYNHQLASRGLPYTEVTGFSVAIDQTEIDNGQGFAIAPIAQRIITKAKTRDAGTQQPWWRDGAPLSLVTPTMNNAGWVHKWDQPFELGPGEYMKVSLQAPPTRTMTFGESPFQVDPVYNVGVSFLGYAVVEDNCEKVYR